MVMHLLAAFVVLVFLAQVFLAAMLVQAFRDGRLRRRGVGLRCSRCDAFFPSGTSACQLLDHPCVRP